MDSAVLPAAISGAVAIAVAGLSYLLAKTKEREADWRKLKLDLYKEYIVALSGTVVGRDVTPEAKARYADAVNCLTLVSSPSVLKALYDFQDETSYRNISRSDVKHDERLSALLNAMRQDVYPKSKQPREALTFRLFSVPPPQAASPSSR